MGENNINTQMNLNNDENQYTQILNQLNQINNTLQLVIINNFMNNNDVRNIQQLLYNIQLNMNIIINNNNNLNILYNMINNQNELINHIINNNLPQ